jgi:hypothetical protein
MVEQDYQRSKSRIRAPCAVSPLKPAKTHAATPSPNYAFSVYDETERMRHKLSAHDDSIRLAQRATFILCQQTDPEVLDLRAFASELNDVLLNELASQLHANLKLLAKTHAQRQDVARAFYSTVVLSGCKKITTVSVLSV